MLTSLQVKLYYFFFIFLFFLPFLLINFIVFNLPFYTHYSSVKGSFRYKELMMISISYLKCLFYSEMVRLRIFLKIRFSTPLLLYLIKSYFSYEFPNLSLILNYFYSQILFSIINYHLQISPSLNNPFHTMKNVIFYFKKQ